MKYIQTDKDQLISLIKNEYKNNDIQRVIIHEFEYSYTEHKANYWYTRACFVRRIRNKALQIQNFDIVFLLHFIISDIYRQLKSNQCQSSIRVYGAVLISDDELDLVLQSNRKFLNNNSFLFVNAYRKKCSNF